MTASLDTSRISEECETNLILCRWNGIKDLIYSRRIKFKSETEMLINDMSLVIAHNLVGYHI